MPLKTGKEYLEPVDSLNLEARTLGRKGGQLGGRGLASLLRQAVAFTFNRFSHQS